MQFPMNALAFAVVLAGAAPLLAQDATPPAAPDTAGTEAPAEAATPDPQPGETYLAEEHGAWQLRCVKAAEETPERCQLYQVLSDEKGTAVAEIVVFPLPEGQEASAGAIVTTPLETLLTEQVTIAIDGTEGRRYPFSFCTEQGCVSRIGLTDENLDAFRKGTEAKIRIIPARAPDQQVILSASLKGFTAGFQAVVDRAGL